MRLNRNNQNLTAKTPGAPRFAKVKKSFKSLRAFLASFGPSRFKSSFFHASRNVIHYNNH